jgi:molecular chaperone HtpG
MSATTTQVPEKMEFKTELRQLLDLIIHSLYTKKEIFLRELISNAADAIDKLRFEGLKDPQLLGDDSDFKVRIIPDEQAGTLTVSDNGIGMSRESIVSNLGTIARSGTREFLKNLQAANAQQRPELIGQFGVGFYASFMAADRVTVLSRPAGANTEGEGVKWESDGQGEFTVEAHHKPARGTDVILHLREDAKEFLKGWQLRDIIKRYSDFIDQPIVLVTQEEKDGKVEAKEETVNSRQAIWLRPKKEVKEEEYKAFYKQLTRDSEDPLTTIHVAAEGTMEFRALLFIPARRGLDFLSGPERKSGIDLYVRRVLIQHESEELAPPYLRFIKGVVDSADLPLNVSRETLQHNPLLAKIRSNLVNRALKTLEDLKSNEPETYLKFYNAFGPNLKEGVAQDWSNRDRLADLLLFESTKTEPGKFTSLADYVNRMTADQKEIYFLTGEGRAMVENSPYLEAFKARGQEVLLLTDPVDEYLVASLHTYKEKPLRAVDRGDTEADKEQAEKNKERQSQFGNLLEALKQKIGEVKDVRLSTRLRESAACLVADEGAMGANLERLLQRMGRGEDVPASKRILEINPEDPAVQKLRELTDRDSTDPRIEAYGRLLYDQAVIAEGSRIQDPAAFAKRVNALIASQT